MSTETNKAIVFEVMEKAFNQGDLSVIDQYNSPAGIDHQELPGTPFSDHLKTVIVALHTAFPDLHFEIHEIVAEQDIVAFRSTMTGTHRGPLQLGSPHAIPATGRQIEVPHMHFLRIINGKALDLWHMWDTTAMMRQLGVTPQPNPV